MPSREMVLGFAVLLLLIVVVVQYLILPSMEAQKTAQKKIAKNSTELKTQEKMLSAREGLKKESANPLMANLQKKVKEAFNQKASSTEELLSQIMGDLTGDNFGDLAVLRRFQVKEEVEKEAYKEVHFEINLLGSYERVSEFFKRLETTPYLIATRSMEMKPAAGHETSGEVELVSKNILFVSSDKDKADTKDKAEGGEKAPQKAPLNPPPQEVRSPFASRGYSAQTWNIYELSLDGVISGGHRSSALINGKVFEIGEEVAGYTLSQILPDKVLLQKGDRQHWIQLSGLDDEDGPNHEVQERPIIERVPAPNKKEANAIPPKFNSRPPIDTKRLSPKLEKTQDHHEDEGDLKDEKIEEDLEEEGFGEEDLKEDLEEENASGEDLEEELQEDLEEEAPLEDHLEEEKPLEEELPPLEEEHVEKQGA
ncbi:MAG: type 4a pilus biogenesis protein PilO [Deltaproteobacteria bacterium]|nr:type 4a pilus biogenesis protein PilO [Deltaproteobacteria bacterium]